MSQLHSRYALIDGPVASAAAALERHLDVRGEGAIGVADARQVRPRPRARVGRGRAALNGDEVAEAVRGETGDVVDAERVPVLHLDVDARRRQDVVGDERQVVTVAGADCRHDVAVRRQAGRRACRRHVDHVRRGRIRRTRRHEHDRWRLSVIRHHHRPDLFVDQRHVRQLTSLAVSLTMMQVTSTFANFFERVNT